MTKNEIIEKLFTGENFNCCISKMEPEHLREDLRQEVILRICELPEEKLIGLSERNELEFYTVRVVLNMIRNPNNQFSKAFRDCPDELVGTEEIKDWADYDLNHREEREKKEDKLLRLIRTTDKRDSKWYHKELLKIYMEKGNYRDVASDTLIPFPSVFEAITEYKKNLAEVFTKPVYTQKQAAKILKVNIETIRQWKLKKIIKPESGQGLRRLVYTKSEIERVKAMRSDYANNKFRGYCLIKAIVANLKDDEINKLPQLNAKIVKLYKQLGSLQAVAKHIGLHQETCRINLNNTIEILKSRDDIKESTAVPKLLDQPNLNHLSLMNTREYINQKNAS